MSGQFGPWPSCRRRAALPSAFAAGIVLAFAISGGDALAASTGPTALPESAAGEPIAPVPPPPEADAAKLALGEKLFHDAQLSRGNGVACASCHRLGDGGDDNVARAAGTHGGTLPFNAPTVFNAALSFRLNWRGNFRTLEEQAEAALLDPRLMNSSWDGLLAELRSDSDYQKAFVAIYGEEAQAPHVLDALASYERSLLTPDAPFDRYLRGDGTALAPEAERGYELFKAFGCASCHQGVNVGGNLFQKFGIFQDPATAGGERSEAEDGRFAITGREKDRRVFRVPSLRNVGVTAPYFHDGRAATLGQAVSEMARSQLGRVLDDDEVEQIVAFLQSLTGEYRGRSLAEESGAVR